MGKKKDERSGIQFLVYFLDCLEGKESHSFWGWELDVQMLKHYFVSNVWNWSSPYIGEEITRFFFGLSLCFLAYLSLKKIGFKIK